MNNICNTLQTNHMFNHMNESSEPKQRFLVYNCDNFTDMVHYLPQSCAKALHITGTGKYPR